jgi:putative membrane protein
VPGLVDLPLALVWISLSLHLLGEHQAAILRDRTRARQGRWRAASFYLGLAVVVISLVGPIEDQSPKLFWVHMLQHVLLLGFAAPLIVLGAPWASIWRPLPLRMRRKVARTVAKSPACAPLRGVTRCFSRPVPVWIAWSATLVFWHLPFAYDLTLRSPALHALEHLTFMVTSILLWAQVLVSPPLRPRLGVAGRMYFILAATVVGWILSLVLAFAAHPLYPAYAHLAHRPGGISALTDQQLAAGVMLVPGSLAATVYVFLALFRWLGQPNEPTSTELRRRQYA